MESTAFTNSLQAMSGTEIVDLARSLRQELDTVDGELAWWKATVAVTGSLRRLHRSRQAGLAAHAAGQAVLAAARREGVLETDRDAVTLVARSAADVARALVADSEDRIFTFFRPAFAAA